MHIATVIAPPRSNGSAPSGIRLTRETLKALRTRGRDADSHPYVKTALDWTKEKVKARRVATVSDRLSTDPLLIAEEARSFPWPNVETLVASILYSAARVPKGKPQDSRLEEIKDLFSDREFGTKVCRILQDALFINSIEAPELKPGHTQKPEEQKGLLALSIMHDIEEPSAVLIRSLNSVVNLKSIMAEPEKWEPQKVRKVTAGAEVLTKMCFLAGYTEAAEKLRDLLYQVEDPQGFAKTREAIRAATNKKADDHAKQMLIEHFKATYGWKVISEDNGRIEGDHFIIESRIKSPSSARIKAQEKGREVSALMDLHGIRLILKQSALRSVLGHQEIFSQTLIESIPDMLHEKLGKACLAVHRALIKEFGSGNRRDKNIRDVFAALPSRDWDKLRRQDPERYAVERGTAGKKGTCPGAHEVYKNFIAMPKQNGFSALKDMLCTISENGAVRLFEIQIVDEIRHDNNVYGAKSSHNAYKAKLSKHQDEVLAWREATTSGVVVLDDRGQAYSLPDRTLRAFVAVATETALRDVPPNSAEVSFAITSETGQTTVTHSYDEPVLSPRAQVGVIGPRYPFAVAPSP